MSKTVNLGKETKIVISPAETKTITTPEVSVNTSEIIIEEIRDDGTSVYADILYSPDDKELKHVKLWSGQDYVNIGQWTDTDVANKIIEIYTPKA